MVIDTSAIIAILNAEPEARTFVTKMAAASVCRLSAATFIEAGLITRRDPTGACRRALDQLILDYAIRIEPVSERQARMALEALDRFGKGTGHPASLNYGDGFSYALAMDTGEPLLFKGEDFPATDVVPAC
ncbi:type II toxin-antitoxin system VapC family toxin [Nitrospirillum sp. BR 11828]|uniref:type II toxin-antitoxin system VapC family toxin n=1 Tax=Nitrospirillum sp. BR 11828 TaxID=3104325 RepID=UPI002AC9F8E7|nr:type II toxin-antitoxin system VapC family toxin [Nitrospirillum sp. BR 11828]MDZ5645733.1 type II toxin-antitoxin system VapC family toxin [Nitrospirillum sp. BR 11828]